jgi:hypothetical protein
MTYSGLFLSMYSFGECQKIYSQAKREELRFRVGMELTGGVCLAFIQFSSLHVGIHEKF